MEEQTPQLEGEAPHFYFDRGGVPIDYERWQALRQEDDYCRVALDDLPSGRVGTYWIGVDMSDGSYGPLIFQTVTYGGRQSMRAPRLYSTIDEARAGHQETVEDLS